MHTCSGSVVVNALQGWERDCLWLDIYNRCVGGPWASRRIASRRDAVCASRLAGRYRRCAVSTRLVGSKPGHQPPPNHPHGLPPPVDHPSLPLYPPLHEYPSVSLTSCYCGVFVAYLAHVIRRQLYKRLKPYAHLTPCVSKVFQPVGAFFLIKIQV